MGDDVALFARMVVIGVVIAAPVGAMAMLLVQRTLVHGWRAGAATGAGIATADGVYAALAAFGVTAVSQWLVTYQTWFRILGGLALLWLGWRALRTPPTHRAADARDSARLTTLWSTAVGLTLTNPMTIMAFAAVFASAGLVAQAGAGSALAVTLGVLCGSMLWWLVLTTGTWAVRHAVSDRAIVVVNRVSGGVLIAFGLLAVAAGLRGWVS